MKINKNFWIAVIGLALLAGAFVAGYEAKIKSYTSSIEGYISNIETSQRIMAFDITKIQNDLVVLERKK